MMIKNYDWRDTELGDIFYYFNIEDGRIHGQVHKIAHTKIWLSKVFKSNNEELYLGQYISDTFAKKSVVDYWLTQERTLLE